MSGYDIYKIKGYDSLYYKKLQDPKEYKLSENKKVEEEKNKDKQRDLSEASQITYDDSNIPRLYADDVQDAIDNLKTDLEQINHHNESIDVSVNQLQMNLQEILNRLFNGDCTPICRC